MPENSDTEQNQAVELAKKRAQAKRSFSDLDMLYSDGLIGTEDVAESESRAPKTEEAELLPQEYGQPTEEKGKEEPEEEPKEGEEESEGEQPEGDEDMSEEEMRSLQLTKSQIRQLKIQRAIKIEEQTALKKIKKSENNIKLSKISDRTKNAVRIIRAIWGVALVYWWLLLIPLILALTITIALGVLVWGCGLNLGVYSAKTRELQNRFKNEKKALIKQKNDRIKKIKKSIK